MDQCQSCGMYLQEKPRIPCSCGETKRIVGIIADESCVFSHSGSLTISSFLSKRNLNNTYLLNKLTNTNSANFLENKILTHCDSEAIIYFHDEFMEGNQSGNIHLGKIIDFKNLFDENLSTFNNFIQSILYKNLKGKNKPSHNNCSKHKLYPNYWHYHCGPYPNPTKNQMITNLFLENLNGDTSGPVIHYIKKQNNIIIVAFATEHTQTFQGKSKIEEKIFF